VAFPGGLEGKFNLQVEPATIDSVTVSPDTVENMERGDRQDFSAKVTGSGWANDIVPDSVNWTISGAQTPTSSITGGRLDIAPDEPNSALTVRATSAIDGNAYGEAEVSILPTVTDVVVSPRAVIVDRGSSRTFTAEVKGYGDNISQEVVWFVSGSGDSGTRINGSGKLTVASTDKATVITVRATSPLDSTDFPGSTVTVPIRGDIALGDWNSVATGVNHTLGLRHDGTLYAWGKNDWGQLGIDSTDKYKDRPVQVGTDDDWVAIGGGWSHSVGLKSDGTLWAWGRLYNSPHNTNPTGLIIEYGLKPVQIGTRSDWASISAGYNNAFAITKTGELYAWGNNTNGKLGIRSEESKAEPFQVGSTADWSFVSSGRDNTVATQKDGTLWVWGKGGEIFKDKQLEPMQIMPGVRWASAIVGNGFATALDTNGYLWTWGKDTNGALGNGSANIKDPYTPEKIEPGKTWLSVSNAVSDTVFAIDSNGDLFAWGSNNPYNQLGIGGGGGIKESPVPVTASSGSNKWMNVIVCAAFGLGVQEDGSLWAWGHNTFGQLGNGDHDSGLDTNPDFTNSQKNEPSPVQIKLN
jgi:alpha-tubulin suppressor-like RCC1 family protein